MLDIQGDDEIEHEGLKQVLKEFRRVQVSRFPIRADCEEMSIRFFDSRISHSKQLAEVSVETNDKNEEYFCIESRLIMNDRFVRGNDRRNQKHTKDPKKLLRYMRDYVKPFSTREIANNSIDEHQSHRVHWRNEAESLMRDLCNMSREDVMREMVRMQAIGYKPQTEKFAQMMEKGLPAWVEYKRRAERSVMNVHVFINPDESVEVYCSDKLGFAGINQGTTPFNSLADTPTSIQQHVAMLRMMDDRTFIPEVGTKIDANNYWVEVFPE
jgi:hypothetical protein